MKTQTEGNAKGFYSELEASLLKQIRTRPDDLDLRLNLLETYYEIGNSKSFIEEAVRLDVLIKKKSDSKEWQKVVSMGRGLSLNHPLFNGFDTDRLEFVEPPKAAVTTKTFKRFGDDPHSQRHFKQLAKEWEPLSKEPSFLAEFERELLLSVGRPASLLHARNLTAHCAGAQIYFKREDLSPPSTHLMIALLGQTMVAKRLGKKTIVAAIRNGQRGVLMASAAARLGLQAVIYMDGEDMHRQSGNVFRMWLMGADVRAADWKSLSSDDIRQAALKHWLDESGRCFLITGLEAAPEPYPSMVVQFTAAIGRETVRQVRMHAQRPPDILVARGGNNADAIGLFSAFLNEKSPRLVCVEPAELLPQNPGPSGQADDFNPLKAPLTETQKKVAGAILEGLEYPSVAREHAKLKASGRVEYVRVSPDQAKLAIRELSHREGLIPAIQTAHAVGWAMQTARTMKPEQSIVVLMAESADKDLWDIGRAMGVPL